ncbi:uncharacterized protein EV154DRAFT_488836 [Mucor mucedo]|uniref:uncharacterized protein n=1 Tax=Mucor mucedo TaxID=29922 RepID=UPI00221ED999|nr:uncharacterized protein EV154DRAFT_488836 [Mucor mucedo]KAI7864789.1 hypothetical protein EV154DRAFT_488836 [Mucor mucedo]
MFANYKFSIWPKSEQCNFTQTQLNSEDLTKLRANGYQRCNSNKHGIIQIKVYQWTLEISLKLKKKRSTMKRNASIYTDTNTFDNYILKTVVIKLKGVLKQSSYNITQVRCCLVQASSFASTSGNI